MNKKSNGDTLWEVVFVSAHDSVGLVFVQIIKRRNERKKGDPSFLLLRIATKNFHLTTARPFHEGEDPDVRPALSSLMGSLTDNPDAWRVVENQINQMLHGTK